MPQSNNTYPINNIDEFLSCFSSEVSGGGETGWRVYEGFDDRNKLGRRGIGHVSAVVKW